MEIFDRNSDRQWKEKLLGFPEKNRDLFYLPEYYETYADHEGADYFCLYYEDSGYAFLYPFFRKEINETDTGEKYYDLFNAYGYGGVVMSSSNIPDAVIHRFNKAFDDWCIENNIITEFVRENPLLPLRIREADYSKVRTNIYAEPGGEGTFSKYAVYDVKRAMKKGLVSEVDQDMTGLDDFYRIYTETASRLQMRSYFHFPIDYFRKIESLLKNNARLIHVKLGSAIVASALVFYYAHRGTIHLAGSDFEYKKMQPNDLLYKAIIDDAFENNIQTVVLGGGTSNDPDDGLFRFKRKYGRLFRDVYIGKRLLNKEKYDLIVRIWEKKYPRLVEKYKDFFQKYRLTE